MASSVPPPASDDALVATARDYFESFLLNFSAEPDAPEPSSNADEPALPYVEQFNMMRDTERTTLFVDFQHLAAHDSELADAVKEQFHYLEPHLRLSVAKVMGQLHEAYAQEKVGRRCRLSPLASLTPPSPPSPRRPGAR